MGNEHEQAETTLVKNGARPWTGLLLGFFFGLALAVLLQQSGVWPLDRLLLFGSAGLFALIGILLGSAGRQRAGALSAILPLVLAVALIAFGATGLTEVNEQGELNGGCTVSATSNLDTTVVTDTSRQDPFQIDPNGSLSWVATSPGPIMNHLWEIYVDVGGFAVVIADNEEPEPNTAGDVENTGDVPDVSVYVEEVSEAAGVVELVGVLEVGGNIEGDGGACDGFGFVRLVDDALTSLIAQIAAGVALLTLIGLLALVFAPKTRETAVVPPETIDEAGTDAAEGEPVSGEAQTPSPGAAGAAGGAAAAGGGAHERRDEPSPDGAEGGEGSPSGDET